MKENIIKAIKRVRDKNGNLVPVFDVTSADAVYYDIDNEITVQDVIDGGRITDSVYSYNNIFEYTDQNGGSGALTVYLPAIKDNTVEIDMYVSGGTYDYTYNETQMNVPRLMDGRGGGEPIIREMSPNGTFIFVVVKRSSEYLTRLYVTEPAGAKEVTFTFKSIVTPIRARFTKDSSAIVILGDDVNGTKVVEIHSLNASTGSVESGAFNADQRAISGNRLTITYFDTILYNGANYIITNTSETLAFSCFKISPTELTVSSALSTSNVYQIRNEIRTSTTGNRVAILSYDGSMIHCMAANAATGQYRFMSSGDDMNSYAWGSSKNGSRLGVWKHFDFNPEGTKLYGTYEIGYSQTLRVCDVTSTYGHYDPAKTTPQEITINPTANPFNIGTKVYRAIPNSSVYGATTNKTIAYIGAGSQSASLDRIVSGITRCESTTQAQLTTLTYQTTTDPVTESVYVVGEQSLSHSFSTLTLSLPITYVDVFIHPSSGYAYAIPETIFDVAIVPFYLSTGTPIISLSTNPTHIPIYPRNEFTDISYDGSAIAYIDSQSSQPRLAMYESGRYIHRDVPAYQYTPNTAIACRAIGNGSSVMYVYPNGIKAYNYVNGAFVETPVSGLPSQAFTTTDPTIAFSQTTLMNGSYYWTMCKFDTSSNVVTPSLYSFVHNATNGFVATSVTINDGQFTHSTLAGYAFDFEDKHMGIVYTDSDGVTRAHFYAKTGNTYNFVYATPLTDTGFKSSGIGRNSYCCALISETDDESMFVFIGTDSMLKAIRYNWTTNTGVFVDPEYLDSSLYPSISGIKYCPLENKLYIVTSSTLTILEYFQGTIKRVYINRDLERLALFTQFTISETGGVCVIERGLGNAHSALLMRLRYTKLTGDVHMTGKYTDAGWTNVEITASDEGLKNSVAFAVRNEREVIVIGSVDTMWNPIHVKINRITVIGETAGKYSYRIGYSAGLTQLNQFNQLTNITTGTNIVTESSNVKRITIRGVLIPPTDWRYDSNNGLYYCRIHDNNIDPTSLVNVNINDIESWAIANAAGVISLSTEHEGYVELYSGNIPVSNIHVDIDIFKSI